MYINYFCKQQESVILITRKSKLWSFTGKIRIKEYACSLDILKNDLYDMLLSFLINGIGCYSKTNEYDKRRCMYTKAIKYLSARDYDSNDNMNERERL